MQRIKFFDIKGFKLKSTVITAIAEDNGNRIIIGTRASEIVEILNYNQPKTLMNGHSVGELWGLAVHPNQ